MARSSLVCIGWYSHNNCDGSLRRWLDAGTDAVRPLYGGTCRQVGYIRMYMWPLLVLRCSAPCLLFIQLMQRRVLYFLPLHTNMALALPHVKKNFSHSP